ncbi:hypothetical protein HMPREF3144_06455 [Oligella sp. HMSC05A10]|uniref:hypothetical protein n=1 Tax=Oligella sp. HMSC05A10 TaxID=1581112 RepID=UPI0008A44FE3|nr:hypothetical protein [Oligella sp. HMSC05A10]OFS84482.1 hypothetical protein HMPREF3144_06455 [Oligella sp. HMSC05A10]
MINFNGLDLNKLLQQGVHTNDFGVPKSVSDNLMNAVKEPKHDWQKYLELMQEDNNLLPQQQQPMPVMQAPQAPQIQSAPHQSGVGYRKPTYMPKGLLG